MVDMELKPPSVAPSLAGLTREEQIEEMAQWFFANFTDPAHSTQYETREGGYQYIWGGPYVASEELEEAFGDQVDYDLIVEAAEYIQDQDGIFDWAPAEARIQSERFDIDEDVESGSGEGGDVVDSDDLWPPVIPTQLPLIEERRNSALQDLERL